MDTGTRGSERGIRSGPHTRRTSGPRGSYHVFGPAAFDPVDAEPVTITNLNGFVGLAYISGMVTQTNVKTGEKARYPFVDSDMRFMQGNFRGTDGRIHQATFGFI